MYTGIVQACLPVGAIDPKPGMTSFSLDLPEEFSHELEEGASIAVNGVCLTVTAIQGASVSFDAVAETLALSNLSELAEGVLVNVERSARQGVEVGGHILSGHVVGTARVSSVQNTTNNCRMTFEGDPDWMKFVFEKGFLAINGASLTVASLDRQTSSFSVNLIPETLKRTNFSKMNEGDEVNIEIEAQTQVIVETVERVMAERFST